MINAKVVNIVFLLLSASLAAQAQTLVAHFPMDITIEGNKTTEIVTNKSYTVESNRPIRENLAGAVGQALRFDGYSTYITGQIESQNLSNQTISAELWLAVENYPMMNTDGNNNDYTLMV